MKTAIIQSPLIRDKIKKGEVELMNNEKLTGEFVNNICLNTDLPKSCKDVEISLFYFVYSPEKEEKCISLISSFSSSADKNLDSQNPTLKFEIIPKKPVAKFKVVVKYNADYNQPFITVSVVEGVTEFKIESKFCKGEKNGSAWNLEESRVVSSLIFILIGLFVLASAGMTFKQLLVIVASTILFVFLLFFVFTFFNFQLTGWASASVFGAIATISATLGYLTKKIKKLFEAIITLMSMKIGLTYGAIVFPDSKLHERVN